LEEFDAVSLISCGSLAKNVLPVAKEVKTSAAKHLEWGHLKTNRNITVKWESAQVEVVPVVSATGLEVLTADRLLRFVRNNPNGARYSEDNEPRRGKPVMVL